MGAVGSFDEYGGLSPTPAFPLVPPPLVIMADLEPAPPATGPLSSTVGPVLGWTVDIGTRPCIWNGLLARGDRYSSRYSGGP